MTFLEHCCKCDEPTGRAGKYDDSLYAADFGPYCEDCWGDVPNELGEQLATKLKSEAALVEALKRIASAESLTLPFYNKMKTQAEKELDARIEFARNALKQAGVK